MNSLLEGVNRGQGNEESAKKLLAEVRVNLKSIHWDVQDLEETIEIASKNPAKFGLTDRDIEVRRQFVYETKAFIQVKLKYFPFP